MATSPQQKYLVLFPLPKPYVDTVRVFMDRIAVHTKLPPPYLSLPPHVTFHRPIVGIREEEIRHAVATATHRTHRTHMTVGSLFPFGKHYLVMPVHATRALSSFWVGLNNIFMYTPEYECGAYDDENTLHITVAKKTSDVFDDAWPNIARIPVPIMTVPVAQVALYQKSIHDGTWRVLETFSISE